VYVVVRCVYEGGFMPNIVAVIPARKGSQQFKNKNLIDYKGYSLIAHAVNVATEAKIFSHIIVTSDYSTLDLNLRQSSILHFHNRSEFAASSNATAFDVLVDLESCVEYGNILRDSLMCYMQPTSPQRTVNDLRATLKIALTNNNRRVISLCRKPINPSKLVSLSGKPPYVLESSVGASSLNRQTTNELFQPNGSIYWFSFDDAMKLRTFPIEGAYPYFMSITNSIDIDSEEDYLEILEMNGDMSDVNSNR
jgi:CMP-N,N'-diacetyllegionaminic acid synthase